jgi:hypothetical protein
VYTGGRAPRDVRRAKIDESIDTIPEQAFYDQFSTQLIEVEGHDKLKKIEGDGFNNCTSLRRLTKMGGVKEIGGYAFFRCVALLDLDFDKLEIIGSYAFGRCKSPRSVNFPSVTRIGECAFHSCVALTDAVFGEELGRIEEGAFWNCPSLRRIVIPLNEDLVVEDSAFRYCDNLSRVDIVGRIHGTISSLHMESWKDTMKEEIGRINQTLPGVSGQGKFSAAIQQWNDEKTKAIQQWLDRVLDRMEHYKTEHRVLLKEATTLLELALWKANLEENGVDLEGVRVTRGRRQIKRARKERCITSGAGIIIKNVLPFLELDE